MAVNYVDNRRLYDEIVLWRKARAEAKPGCPPQIPEYIGTAFTLMAERMSKMTQFSAYSFKEEMIAEGVFTCLKYLHTFDPAVGDKPFAYFSRTLYTTFVRRIGEEYEHIYVRDSLFVDFVHSTMLYNTDTDVDSVSRELVSQAHSRMQAFEGWKNKKRLKRETRTASPPDKSKGKWKRKASLRREKPIEDQHVEDTNSSSGSGMDQGTE